MDVSKITGHISTNTPKVLDIVKYKIVSYTWGSPVVDMLEAYFQLTKISVFDQIWS